jgi:hypothetical protein
LLDDEPEPTVSEFVDFTYYGEVIPSGLERPPRDVEEPCLWTLTYDTARALSDKRTQSAYDKYLHIGCYAFFDSCANAAISEGFDTLSNCPLLSTKHAAAIALIRAGHRTHTATEEAARTRLGFLRRTKGGQASTNADQVFAELAHERFCRPRPTAVSGPLDALRQAFVDRTLEVSLHAANKAAAGAAFAKITRTSRPAQTPRPGKQPPIAQGSNSGVSNRTHTPRYETMRLRPATTKEIMVWPAAPIHAPRHLPSCDIACGEDSGSGSASARAAKS